MCSFLQRTDTQNCYTSVFEELCLKKEVNVHVHVYKSFVLSHNSLNPVYFSHFKERSKKKV